MTIPAENGQNQFNTAMLQICSEIVMKEWEEQHPVHPYEFGWGEAARCFEVEDLERNLAG
jgi:hypothetical protein